MLEVQELRAQLTRVIALKFQSSSSPVASVSHETNYHQSAAALRPPRLMPPSPAQEKLLRQARGQMRQQYHKYSDFSIQASSIFTSQKKWFRV